MLSLPHNRHTLVCSTLVGAVSMDVVGSCDYVRCYGNTLVLSQPFLYSL